MKNALKPFGNTRSNLINSFFNKDDLFTPMESLFDSIMSHQFPELVNEFNIDFDKTSYPKVNVKETASEFLIVAEIPGIDRDNVKVEYDHQTGILKLQGEKKIHNEEKKDSEQERWILKEIKQSSFTRCFHINPELIDGVNIGALYKDNYLTISVPKKDKVMAKDAKTKIEIK